MAGQALLLLYILYEPYELYNFTNFQLQMLITLLIFIIVLGLLVFVHELGHFVVAKKSGMQVDEFGFGFPPRLFGIQKQEGKWRVVAGPIKSDHTTTIYSINLIPLGGFVKILGENGEDQTSPNSFSSKKFLPRLGTLLAGVLMNLLLAWVLISIGFIAGAPTAMGDSEALTYGGRLENAGVTIVDLRSGGPAAEAGVQVGDRVVTVAGVSIQSIEQMQQVINEHAGQGIEFVVQREGSTKVIEVSSEVQTEEGRGSTGVVIAIVGDLKYPIYTAPIVGAQYTYESLVAIVKGLGGLFTGSVGVDQLGGPAKIAQLTGEASRLGILHLLQFAAFLSLNLAVLNSLPFPALDGGRVLFLLIEKIRRKPNNRTFEQVVNLAGFVLLLLLMAVVTANDIRGFGGLGSVLSRIF